MVSTGTKEGVEELGEDSGPVVTTNGGKVKGRVPLHISTSQRGLLGDEAAQKGFLKSLVVVGSRVSFLKFDSSRSNLSSPSAKFRQIVGAKENISRSVPSSSSHSLRERFNVPFVRKINWESLKKMCKEWIRNPMNMALFVWISCVAVSGAILFMVMIGMLNHAIPKKSQRNAWFEVNNQILNALFTLMCLYQHPQRVYHLVLLCRWKTEDISKLRKIYCKNGTYKPHEWGHMMVVVVLLHLNCFAQYALCGLNLGYRRSERPPIGVGICISVAIGSVAAAGVYTIMSPLGRDYECEMDEEAQDQIPIVEMDRTSRSRMSLEKRFSFSLRNDQKVVEDRPKWKGGLCDLWDDIYLAYLSLFCSFCVFGWNMERLGFGNMYVHIATFAMFCTAPFWIFILAAINIDNEAVQEALGLTGIVLCIFGLLYGGFWRIQFRKRYNLPANNFCCGIPAVTDCAQWLFCCWCSLAQEVRTADYYDIVENKFCIKQGIVPQQSQLSPLPREGGSVQSRLSQDIPLEGDSRLSGPGMINSPSPSRLSKGYVSPDRKLAMVEEESSVRDDDIVLTAPVPSVIQKEDNRPASF
ncbi:Plac8 family protein [Thalictrum thalictroides]|uniref:Plac8 family protein n=1 Tax=Thalictrum thalictroides TaxID=46969 RepID=A0A7J6WMJ6_THATH|nr:Plac8 family protein [Thalictrum thalictroides]